MVVFLFRDRSCGPAESILVIDICPLREQCLHDVWPGVDLQADDQRRFAIPIDRIDLRPTRKQHLDNRQ